MFARVRAHTVSGAKSLSQRLPRWLAAVPVLAILVLGASSEQGRATGQGVVRVRMGGDRVATRVVIELARSAHGQLINGEDGPADKVVLALAGVDVADDLHGQGLGLVKAWSVEGAAGAAKLELDLNRKAAVRRRFLLPPGDGVNVYRYVVDLEAPGPVPPPPRTRPAMPLAQALAQRPLRESAAAPAAVPAGKRTIVIDPGHGGHDPGAQGSSSHEKTLTLAAAKALKARLERTGRYRVVLTRSSDEYIPLEGRVAIARRAGADLFISLHADSGSDPRIHGATVYTLSEHGVDRAARVALRHDDWLRDAPAQPRDPEVNRILLDLTQRDTSNRSSTFANLLLTRIETRTPLLQSGHRDAGFAVLLAPDVPAVLLEMGFITNPADEAELSDPVRRGQLMDAVAQAVDDYFGAGGGYPQVVALR
ncbi:MAG TPA: N-acetylmuramoyl-L-alanine amidase [Caulobacteraceae bacterium]|jgi:N-acetylmuramoyl-L-alanine amidase